MPVVIECAKPLIFGVTFMALLQFDATQVEQQQAFDPLPAGWYPVMITASEVKPTKANDGSTKLDLTFTVFDGPHKGRKVFNTLNIGNVNPVAKEIAQKQLSTICHAINVLHVQQTEMLHEKPLMIRLKIQPADGQYDARNEVTGYKAFGTDGAASTDTAPVAPVPPAQAGWNAAPVAPVAAPAAPVAAPQQPWGTPAAPAAPVAAPQQPWGTPAAPAAPVAAPQQPWGTPAAPAAPVAAPQQPWGTPAAPAAPVAPVATPAAPAPVVAPPGWELRDGQWVNVGVQDPTPVAPAPAPAAAVPPWAQQAAQ